MLSHHLGDVRAVTQRARQPTPRAAPSALPPPQGERIYFFKGFRSFFWVT
jgi:hypothetical protein